MYQSTKRLQLLGSSPDPVASRSQILKTPLSSVVDPGREEWSSHPSPTGA